MLLVTTAMFNVLVKKGHNYFLFLAYKSSEICLGGVPSPRPCFYYMSKLWRAVADLFSLFVLNTSGLLEP